MAAPPRALREATPETVGRWYLRSLEGDRPAELSRELTFKGALQNADFASQLRCFVETELERLVGGPVLFSDLRRFKEWAQHTGGPIGAYCDPPMLVLHAFLPEEKPAAPGILARKMMRALVVGSLGAYREHLAYALRWLFQDPEASVPDERRADVSQAVVVRPSVIRALKSRSPEDRKDIESRLRAHNEASGGALADVVAAIDQGIPFHRSGRNYRGRPPVGDATWIEVAAKALGIPYDQSFDSRLAKLADRGRLRVLSSSRAVLDLVALPELVPGDPENDVPALPRPVEFWTAFPTGRAHSCDFAAYASEDEFYVVRFFKLDAAHTAHD